MNCRANSPAEALAKPQAAAKPHCYELFGLSFRSAEPIPGLAELGASSAEHPVTIEFGRTPDSIVDPSIRDEYVQANASEYLFTYGDVMRMYIAGDSHILVERLADCDPVRLWTVILGHGSSIIGFRRGRVPLHGSAIRVGDGCMALAGQTGFGKSTLAASLTDLGFTLHTEDLCLLQPVSGGGAMVGGGIQEFRLWDDAVQTLAWTGRSPFAREPKVAKFVYRLPQPAPVSLPLTRIYALGFADATTPAGIGRIEGVEALQTLIHCLRMRVGLLSVGERERTFATLAAVSRSVEMYRFVRPLDPKQLRNWSERLAAHMTA